MVTGLIIAGAVVALILGVAVLTAATGWFPHQGPRLNPRDRSELAARLWVI